jgi:hypothetical protein
MRYSLRARREAHMNIRSWWERIRERRKRMLARRTSPGPRRLPRAIVRPDTDDPIRARVDLVRFAAFAEASAELIEAGPADGARARYDEACLFFARAIDAAQRAGLTQEANRLKARRGGLKRMFEALRRPDIRSVRPEIRNRKPEG